ncbi:hypothetical protein GE061_004634 [Apolygus lucorum]|uniref:Uncharacterized protein n=1 Tax=Apolygus lucorum TaxID=248454 RepID=A0A8S9X2D8_APOLU|nr:hypothetical protein GE061_004634 [Apolygus lucorum]
MQSSNKKIQLRRERTEERRKVFQLADKRRRGTDPSDSNFTKWNKLLESVPEGRTSLEISEKSEPKPKLKDRSDSSSGKIGFLRKLLKKASKSSNTSEEGFSQLEKDSDHSRKKGSDKKQNSTESKTNKVDKIDFEQDSIPVFKDDKKSEPKVQDEKSMVKQVLKGSKDEDKDSKEDEDSLSQAEEGRPREDSIASSVWSSDNIPEIKIIESAAVGERGLGTGSKSSSSDTVIAVGLEDGRKRAPLARSKLNSDDLSEDVQSDTKSDSSYQDMTESIRKIHSLTNVKDLHPT